MEVSLVGTREQAELQARHMATLGMQRRQWEVADIVAVSVVHTVRTLGVTFAGVIFP